MVKKHVYLFLDLFHMFVLYSPPKRLLVKNVLKINGGNENIAIWSNFCVLFFLFINISVCSILKFDLFRNKVGKCALIGKPYLKSGIILDIYFVG
jgi:hypothetical protein